MRSRIAQFTFVASVVVGADVSALDGPIPPPREPEFRQGSLIHPQIELPIIGFPKNSHEGAGSYGRKVPDDHGHCMPGIYKTEISHFRGNGYVARKRPFTPNRYSMERSGYPQEVSFLAEPSIGPKYTGYYVGGGASLLKGPGFGHRAKEGTWGWDYEHLGIKRRVNLLFSRGQLYQGGEGQYEPDPPFEITNIFAIRYGDRLHHLIGLGKE